MATTGKQPGARGLGLWVIVFGIIFIVAGAVTWGAVSTNLAAENITVSDDASAFQSQLVDTPWEAWVQADIINHHALDSSGGKTYAELDRDDPVRETMMTASFLRSSLFTSVVAFGVALLVVGVGVALLLVGIALRRLSPVVVDDDTSHTRVAPAVAPASASPVVAAPAAPAPPVTAPPAQVAPAAAAPTTAAPTTAAPTTAAPPAAPPAAEGHTHAAPPDPTVERDDRA
ncbi:aromatic ring-opening dioxygenase LigA [Cellulomonas uda]|uniref:Aromatic ring-opening dioxygenase LigA n=1 Tax=Cellulomonas uda TaxID=1714 RepID=A0A4Y3KAI1_CELUD|nr:aromatic ring-opening dioxygenase LigA [Cellulomonas uda]NII65084.1 uncharacterized membrane protein YidH (DUF202 family) [Cellulomonas uda]GEA81013.1 hypothetical protein CUD01_14570 [Cellulomonas uda]